MTPWQVTESVVFKSAFLTDLSHFMSILMCENNNSKISEIEVEILKMFCYNIT